MADRFEKYFPDAGIKRAAQIRAERLQCFLLSGNAWGNDTEIEPSVVDLILSLTCTYDQQQQQQLRRGIYDGMFDIDSVNAIRTPSARKKFKGRQGAREVRKIEQETLDGTKLTPEAATMFRAVAARCNYLAQDRPDIAYAAKELCRDFAAPTARSLKRLRHFGEVLTWPSQTRVPF